MDDKSFEIYLTKPLPVIAYAICANGSFVMPERIPKTDAFIWINEYIGGPFKFLEDEWVSGASTAWAKNGKYVPRREPPTYFSSGKVVHFDRVEWTITPDPASGALRRGETDWWENPLFDNPKLVQAMLVAIDQHDYLNAVLGEHQTLGHCRPRTGRGSPR